MSDVFEDPFEYIDNKREFSKLSSGSNVILAFLLTARYILQNLRWTFSIGNLSQLLKSFFTYVPHTSELYSIGSGL